MQIVIANQVAEWKFFTHKIYADPFNDMELNVVFTAPNGKTQRVPAFWAGKQTWCVRYAAALPGDYRFRTESSDTANPDLNDEEGEFRVVPYAGKNPLYRHGPIRVASDRRHFEYADGTPFFWLGDTWWMGLCKRLHWPDEFKTLAQDRVKKGFNVIQIVAGLYPDMGAFDERGANEFGFPWTKDYARINPGYFDAADRRIAGLVDAGLAPCIVGAWGYHLPWLGAEKMKKHWRYLIARYGAYPVFWCVAGEVNLPYYLTPGFPFDDRKQVTGWTKIARYVRQTDPFHRLISTHPTGLGQLSSRGAIDDTRLLDFDMLQTGHGDLSSLPPTVEAVRTAHAAQPPMPVLNSEVCYEGILNSCHADVQRLMFWACVLSGAMGHTYGANGIWQQNRRDQPYGNSPHGGTYGPTPWDEAMRLPGSEQLGLAKRFLLTLPWQQFAPHPEWAKWAMDEQGAWGEWIWFPEGNPAADAPAGKRFFRRVFDLPDGESLHHATLRLTADDRFAVSLNGKPLGAHLGWNQPQEYAVAALLRPGKNVLAVEVENIAQAVPHNPAGLLCGLTIAYRNGRKVEILSDAAWRVSQTAPDGWTLPDFDAASWSAALAIARYGEGPWGRFDSGKDYRTPYCAGIPGRMRLLYLPLSRRVSVLGLEAGARYRASWHDPITGASFFAEAAHGDQSGQWLSPSPPKLDQDWLLLLEKR